MKSTKIAFDLQFMLPGGTNGGLKYFILDFIKWARDKHKQSLSFLFVIQSNFSQEAKAWFESRDIVVVCDSFPWPPAVERAFEKASGKTLSNWLTRIKIASFKPDVIYCPFGVVSFELSRVPTVATIADLLHADFNGTLTEDEVKYREACLMETTRKADLIHAISDYTADRIEKVYPLAKKKTFRAYLRPPRLSTETRTNASDTMDTRAPLKPFFYYPANYWPHKNHSALLKAYKNYVTRAGDAAWSLILTGDFLDKKGEFDALVHKLDISEHVTHEGFVSDNRVNDLWRTAGALVFPSLHEGFGLPLIEAMRWRVPIICGCLTSLGEIGGQAAYYVDVTDPDSIAQGLLAVSSDANLRSHLTKRGHQRFNAHFAGDQEIGRLLDNIVAAPKVLSAMPLR